MTKLSVGQFSASQNTPHSSLVLVLSSACAYTRTSTCAHECSTACVLVGQMEMHDLLLPPPNKEVLKYVVFVCLPIF